MRGGRGGGERCRLMTLLLIINIFMRAAAATTFEIR